MKKSMISLLLVTTLFLSSCAGQHTEKLPQWVMPFMENSHSILLQDKEILNQDFSFVLADKRIDFIGYLGTDYQKMDMTFQSVKKESDTSYLISGFSKVSGHTQSFSGSLHIIDVRELNEYEYGPDNFSKGQIRKQGICIARYSLKEQKDYGVFSGISLFRWYTDQSDSLHYDDINEDSDSYSNNLFAGIRQNGSGGQTVKCAWGQYRIPDCGNLDIGAAEFTVNPAYAANGWETPKVQGWYGYYSAEVDLPYAGEETEAGLVAYGIEIQAGECTYYKSQLHANDMFACKVIAATEDSIMLEAVGPYAPNTDGKPLATLYRKNGKFYLTGPFVFDANGNTDIFVEVEKKGGDETIKAPGNFPQQQPACQIISKENGAYYCLAINGKEYRIEDMLDMGNPDLKVYKGHHPMILVIGLSDTYESVYFVYCFKDGSLVRLGQVDVAQPDDVEVNGPKKVSLKVYPENGQIVVESYLDGTFAMKNTFPIPGTAAPHFQSSARTDTLLTENKQTAIFIVPTDKEINRIKLRYHSEEDFHTMADDAAFYSFEAETYLKQNGIKIVYADTTCRVLRFASSHDIDLSDTAKIDNPLFNVILYNGYLPIIVSAAKIKIKAPDFFGLSLFDIVNKKVNGPESATVSLRIAVPNDLDSMTFLKESMAELEKPAFQGKIPVSVYDSVYLNGLFIGKGILSSVKLYKSLPSVGTIKVRLFAYLRECHNDSYPALELQTFDSEDRFIDRLFASTSIFEENGLYRYAEMDETGKIKVTDVVINYDMKNDTEEESRIESYYIINSKGLFIQK